MFLIFYYLTNFNFEMQAVLIVIPDGSLHSEGFIVCISGRHNETIFVNRLLIGFLRQQSGTPVHNLTF